MLAVPVFAWLSLLLSLLPSLLPSVSLSLLRFWCSLCCWLLSMPTVHLRAQVTAPYNLQYQGIAHIFHTVGPTRPIEAALVRFLTEILDDFRRFADEIWRF